MVDILENAEALLIEALVFAILIQVILSWFAPMGVGGRFMLLLSDLTDPILMPLRRMIPPFGMLDLSPLIAILLLQFVVLRIMLAITNGLAGA